MMKGCQTCWYWSEGPKGTNSGKEIGECRRRAPAVGGFPKTERDTWCAEFESAGFMPRWREAAE